MALFEAKQSQSGTVASSTPPSAVDIGISVNGFQGIGCQHSGIQVVAAGLTSEQAIDNAVSRLIAELEQLRFKAKELLRTLKR